MPKKDKQTKIYPTILFETEYIPIEKSSTSDSNPYIRYLQANWAENGKKNWINH